MNDILVLLPESARLYAESLAGIRRRLGGDYRERIVDDDTDPSAFRRLLDLWRPLGCIVFGWMGTNARLSRDFARLPTVYLDRAASSRRSCLDVTQDYAESGRFAARILVQNGRTDYAFVGDANASSWSNARGRAFADAVRQAGHTCRCHTARRTRDTRALERWLRDLPRPTSLFAANDRTAREVLNLAALNGWRIPDDLAVLGIDNIISICESTHPRLSSIQTDFERGGWEAADLLCERLRSPGLRVACRRYGTLGVVHRGSTCRAQSAAAFTRQTQRALQFIRNRATDGLTVEDVAADMGCSRRLAEIRFRSATGQTIKAAITDVRLERAQALVRNRALPLKAIAAASGYRTVNALRVAYRNRFGTALTDDRRGFLI